MGLDISWRLSFSVAAFRERDQSSLTEAALEMCTEWFTLSSLSIDINDDYYKYFSAVCSIFFLDLATESFSWPWCPYIVFSLI